MICVKVIRTNFITAYRFVHKFKKTEFVMDNPTAYVRLLNGAQQFQVNFLFKDNSLRIEREFNFDRRLTEPVETFLNRVKQNLAKIASRKNKRLKIASDEKEVTVELFKDDSPVSGSEICENVFFNGNTTSLKLRLNGIDYGVSVNCPWVTDINLPSSMMIGFPVYPAKLELLFANRSDCLFRWFKTGSQRNSNLTLPSVEWKDLGTNFTYLPSADDLGCHLKLECTPTSGPVTGPTSTAVSTNTIQAGPGFCPFETRHAFTSERLEGNKFRVMSYNILADMYAETEAALTELFPYCPKYALKLDYRKQLLLKEVIGYNADLICLQEVDDKVFYNDLVPVFSPLGYSGKYSQKGGTVREGVSCFYSNKRFECQYNDTVILGEVIQKSSCLKDLWETINKKERLKSRVIDRHTALQILVLESKDKKDELLVVGNTHLYFHPDADHVRLLQAGIIINYLTNFVSTIIPSNPGKHISLIVCGDFNSVPECGIYKLMTTKHVPKDFIDWRSNKEEEVEGVELNQPWNISSACGTPQFTNFTVGFADCLDYIFYQNDRLSVDQVIPMPTEEELRQHVAIPSVVFPSDHIALVADLSWNKN